MNELELAAEADRLEGMAREPNPLGPEFGRLVVCHQPELITEREAQLLNAEMERRGAQATVVRGSVSWSGCRHVDVSDPEATDYWFSRDH